jgi:uncharacterized membrane protein YbhN (UPF0104 family)
MKPRQATDLVPDDGCPETGREKTGRERVGHRSSKAVPTWIRLAGGAALLALVVWRLGTGPFLAGLRSLNVEVLLAAALIGAVTTACCARRWSAVAGGLGVGLPFRPAYAAYYRSQFLNSVLPGGILGDVHRGVDHGRNADNVGLGLRAVGWERIAGQAVQILLTVTVLLLAPSPVRGAIPWVLLGMVGLGVGGLAIRSWRRRSRRSSGAPKGNPGVLGIAARDLRSGVLDRRILPVVLLASTVAVGGQTATFVLAARTAGSHARLDQLIPVALIVMAAMTLPTSIGGWGPREGVAAWVFAAAGWGAEQGVATATAYGVMALTAALPGAVVLVLGRRAIRTRLAPRSVRPGGSGDGTPGRAGRVAHV